jgi:hypothetical protein
LAANRSRGAGSGRKLRLAALAAQAARPAIFYPVLNEDYATKIARDWNVKASGAGYVTRFSVRKAFLDAYDVQQVGGSTILEYWIPAEDLEQLNENIVGLIEVTARYVGNE